MASSRENRIATLLLMRKVRDPAGNLLRINQKA